MINIKKYIQYILLIISIILLYLYLSKPNVNIEPYINRINRLELQSDSIKSYYIKVLNKQDNQYAKVIKYKDSVIHAKIINNHNLIIKHEKELAKYKAIDGDTIYNMWVKVVSANK